MRTRQLALVLLAGALLLSGCGTAANGSTPTTSRSSAPAATGPSPSTSTAPAKGFGGYVALGDSYTAAPYVYLTDLAKGCLRSDHNYPRLLAKKLGATLTDVSCSGATTADIFEPQRVLGGETVPAQVDAIAPDTRLVTVGIGGNDKGLFASFIRGCAVVGPTGRTLDPLRTAPKTCGNIDPSVVRASVKVVQSSVTRVLRLVRKRAPRATVVMVGYPRIVSATATCPHLLPVTRANAGKVAATAKLLDQATRDAAKEAHVRYLDMYAASSGRDVCAGKQAWINGRITDTNRAAAFHPFLAEQRAVADRVAALLR